MELTRRMGHFFTGLENGQVRQARAGRFERNCEQIWKKRFLS